MQYSQYSLLILFTTSTYIGAALQIGRSLVRSQLVSLEFFNDIKSFRSHYDPGVDSASNRNECQEYFLGGKGGRCVRLRTYHHPVPLSRNLGTLTFWNPLGHSGPVTGLLYLFYICRTYTENTVHHVGFIRRIIQRCTVNRT